jgi:proton-coupled amino acid transporter
VVLNTSFFSFFIYQQKYNKISMSSPLPVNAKPNYNPGSYLNESVLSTSQDRSGSIARLGSSPNPVFLGSSPKSVQSHRTYGSTDLEHVMTNQSGSLFRPLSQATFHQDDHTVSVDLPHDQVARVVKRHLVDTSPAPSVDGDSLYRTHSQESHVRSVHHLAGGAITHDIYKWAEENEQNTRRQRSQSFHELRTGTLDPALANIRNPGGFRRHFVVDRAAKQGREPPHWMTRTFVDFLALYGHFGGEDLSEDEEEEGDEEEATETSALIERIQDNAVQGTATPAKAVFLLLKSFVGTGVMFLPKA